MRVVPPVSGPEAELARLARPTGPWLHLLDAAPADARQLGWLLGQDGVVVRQLRGHCGRSTYGLLDEVGAALQLPGDPVEDWAGLAALLTDMAWLPGAGHVLVVTRSSLLLAAAPADELRGLVEVVREVARARAEEGDPVPFHLVLQDDAVGLAALRARLDAVGARYAELSGWEASEPVADTAVSVRSVLSAAEGLDQVDRAVAAAASTVDGVRSVGRAWEEFRGGSSGPVRVYAPVLAGADVTAVVGAVVGAVAGAVAATGGSCVVVPVPADPGLADPRQAAVAAAAVEIWPTPPATTAPTATEAPPAPHPGTAPPAGADPSADPQPPVDGPAGHQPGTTVDAPSPATSDPAPAGPELPAPPGGASAGSAPGGASPGGGSPGGGSPGGGSPGAESAGGESAGGESPGGEGGPRDESGAPFELIAANLQWPFDTGSEDDDAVDRALLAHAAGSTRTAALFRAWVQDPAGGWVRVVLGYVRRTSIAEVETERTALVDVLQGAGAARCCVEVLAAADVSDAHRWLEQRCRPLWPTPADPPAPAAAARPAPNDGSGPTDDSAPTDGSAGSGGGAVAGPVLSGDAVFRPGPGLDDAEHGARLAALVEWAVGITGVVGLVTAWTAEDELVIGAALDADTDPVQVRATAPSTVEPFAPARGLSPVHLRLSRSSTRIWTRRAERAAPEPAKPAAGALDRPVAPDVRYQGPPPTRDTEDARGDISVDGFTLVGIDRDTAVAKGAPAADEQDAALVEWASARPGAVALLRGVTDEQLKVYCVAIEETADPEGTRRDAARAAAGAGLARAAIEAFAPAGAISAFHLDLAVASTRLWPTRS